MISRKKSSTSRSESRNKSMVSIEKPLKVWTDQIAARKTVGGFLPLHLATNIP